MGDVALTVPVLKNFKRKYPEIHITMLTRPFFHPFFDGIEGLHLPETALKNRHKGMWGIRRLYKELSEANKYDAVLDLHDVLRSRWLAFLFSLRGVPVFRIGKERKAKKEFLKDVSSGALPHTIMRYRKVFADAGYLFPLEKELITPAGEMLPQEISLSDVNIGIAPFAAHKSKEWGVEHTAGLIEKIHKLNAKTHIFLFGGGAEESAQLEKVASNDPRVTNIAGKYDIRTELRLMQHLNVMIGMDSGNTHLAALSGIPVISIWGGTHPGTGFAPLYQPEENLVLPAGEDWKDSGLSVYGTDKPQIPETPYYHIRTIPPDRIIDRLLEMGIW